MANTINILEPCMKKYGVYTVDVSPDLQRCCMVISKSSEALKPKQVVGEGATLEQIIAVQPDISTVINGGFFYFDKMESTYGTPPPIGKRVGDGIGPFAVRSYKSVDDPKERGYDYTDPNRFGWLVQKSRGQEFQLTTDVPNVLKNRYVLTCSPVLLKSGKKVKIPQTSKEKMEEKGPPGHLGHLTIPNQRSMIGKRRDGTIIIASSNKKLIFEEMQEVMKMAGCETAFGLDGGGSTFLWHEDKTLVSGESERLVGNTIVVFRPGTKGKPAPRLRLI